MRGLLPHLAMQVTSRGALPHGNVARYQSDNGTTRDN